MISMFILTFTYLLTAGVTGAWQITSQPVSFILLCSPSPHGTWRTPGLSIPWCCLFTSFCVCLVFFSPFTVLCKMVLSRPDEWEKWSGMDMSPVPCSSQCSGIQRVCSPWLAYLKLKINIFKNKTVHLPRQGDVEALSGTCHDLGWPGINITSVDHTLHAGISESEWWQHHQNILHQTMDSDTAHDRIGRSPNSTIPELWSNVEGINNIDHQCRGVLNPGYRTTFWDTLLSLIPIFTQVNEPPLQATILLNFDHTFCFF